MKQTNHPPWKLSPSDFAFLWEECPRCFYLKVVDNFDRPRLPMPKIFTRIDSLMKNYCDDVRTETLAPNMPSGRMINISRSVKSQPFTPPGCQDSCYISGKFDHLMQLDDGSYGVIDLKTSSQKAENLAIYSRQLHAYAYALENPLLVTASITPISVLGLLVFEPDSFNHHPARGATLGGTLNWFPIEYDLPSFFGFLEQVLAVLEKPQPPPAYENCQYCQYRQDSRLVNV